jgi:hypothetical protein
MKNRKGIRVALISLVSILGLNVVFYSRIDCKPNHVSFWFILALGISIGVALTQFIRWFKETDKE